MRSADDRGGAGLGPDGPADTVLQSQRHPHPHLHTRVIMPVRILFWESVVWDSLSWCTGTSFLWISEKIGFGLHFS